MALYIAMFVWNWSWKSIDGSSCFQGFRMNPKRLALITPLYQVLPTFVEAGIREAGTNIPNS